jgi:tetraspanin-13/31
MVEEKDFHFWRRLLIIFNIFYILLALIFFFFAIFTRIHSSIIDLHLFVGLILLSFYLIFISIFGLIAVRKHHQVFLFFYIIFLLILFLFQFILACTYLTIRGDKKYSLLKDNYQTSVDSIQLKYNCCGFDNLTNFNRNQTCQNLPCCQLPNQCCETLPMCYALLSYELDINLKIIGSIMLIFTLTQIIAIYMTLKFRNIRNPAIFAECDI